MRRGHHYSRCEYFTFPPVIQLCAFFSPNYIGDYHSFSAAAVAVGRRRPGKGGRGKVAGDCRTSLSFNTHSFSSPARFWSFSVNCEETVTNDSSILFSL